jgi:uncharacterized membrane-anchored protein YhcB (DUF1043 family)
VIEAAFGFLFGVIVGAGIAIRLHVNQVRKTNLEMDMVLSALKALKSLDMVTPQIKNQIRRDYENRTVLP